MTTSWQILIEIASRSDVSTVAIIYEPYVYPSRAIGIETVKKFWRKSPLGECQRES